MPKTIMTIVGARPQFIKAAAFSRAVNGDQDLIEILVHSGQHFDHKMSEIFFDELGIPAPGVNLAINGGGHGAMTGRMLEKLEEVFASQRPDAVMVYGDTNTTIAGALAAAKLHIPVLHVEAGLRSYNRAMPEETNRVLTDHISDLLFCPTDSAVANLAKEGIVQGVYQVGDVMFDATLHAKDIAMRTSRIVDELGISDKSFVLATVHRAENTDDPAQLTRVVSYLSEQAKEMPVVFPVHPRTRKMLTALGLTIPAGLRMIDPVGYLDMHRLLAGAELVLTDSGGLQKEAYFHRVPCVTLRTETEWVETIEAGWNRLWSVDSFKPRREVHDYGSGDASAKIIQRIKTFLG